MLADKLRGATAGLFIEYVGGYVEGFLGTTSNKSISLTSLTGGLASAPAAGDFVVVYFGTGSTLDYNLVVAGYTEETELYSNDTYRTNLAVAYKFMSGTPDTTLSLTGGTLDATDAGAIAIQVWRNVDTITPFDVTFTSATGIDSHRANPPAITPATEGAVIVAGGAGAYRLPAQTFTSSNLTDFITVGREDGQSATIGLGYHEWTSGAFDPSPFGISGADETKDSWAAVTLALRLASA